MLYKPENHLLKCVCWGQLTIMKTGLCLIICIYNSVCKLLLELLHFETTGSKSKFNYKYLKCFFQNNIGIQNDDLSIVYFTNFD